MTRLRRPTRLVLSLGLALAAGPLPAQGVLDRLLGDTPGRGIAPQDLVAARIWVLDAQGGLSNFAEAEMRPGPHVLVVLSATTQVPTFVLRAETGPECAAAARSLTSVHGGRLAYCHPLA
ncbi:hypothetical protein [Rubellimicrobium aerolatum]|uniref:Uncharacterized protein n=1 Tax=Rubellimicrobium aerolatum TaxID=490979 RepID=A0ABW0S8U7_9RHOB|nr:hypothetical protein [Rubellimicrobium aerolatum]MBP1804686.1 hypothetical protein [Rubellimicrobium aerolatum]